MKSHLMYYFNCVILGAVAGMLPFHGWNMLIAVLLSTLTYIPVALKE